ncbi:DMT family transporter [Paracoccus saliphilus]|uniref:DMT family transporter n=1 Tax=Paracoccus saliphilus TaxID=405559 RepID=A0AA45W7Y4_9RHOB|nr:DMT family transporter [Paracoccus saliphilus]WCR04814.1 DMT family transporter [Paracoccus saliphilus]SIT12918.1 EamA-like transporter family protein [Paracoccus saliphilus]
MLNAIRNVTGTAPDLSRLGGPAAILCATMLMALQDALVKLLSAGLPLWQFFLLRSLLILPLLAALIARTGCDRLRPALNRWVLLRSTLIVAMYVFFYAALPVLELPVVSAVYYTGPLFIVLFTGLLLREPVLLAQWGAVIVAFIGVLIVLRPAGDDFSLFALIPLASALCYALAMIATRGRMGDVDPWVLTFSLNLVFAATGLAGIGLSALIASPEIYPFLLTAWAPLDSDNTTVVALLAVISIVIHVLLAQAYQLGPTVVVAGLDFLYLGFATVWAALFFGTFPGLPVILGTCLIGVAGLLGVLSRPSRR